MISWRLCWQMVYTMRSYEIWLQYELIYCQCQNYRTGKFNYRTDPNPRGIGIRRSTKVRYFTVLLYSWLRSIILALTVSKNVYNTSYESNLWTTKNGWVMTGTGQCWGFDPTWPHGWRMFEVNSLSIIAVPNICWANPLTHFPSLKST